MYFKLLLVIGLNLQTTIRCHDTEDDHLHEVPDSDVEVTPQQIEISKMVANRRAIDDRIFQGNLVIGIGSGSTVVYGVKFIAEAIKKIEKEAEEKGTKSNLTVVCVPSSFQAEQLIQEHQLPLGSLDRHPKIDWTIDGADEVDMESNLIKGGGGCHTQEKMIAAASKELFIVADSTKVSRKLGTTWKKGIPVEVIPMAFRTVKGRIEEYFGGEAILRMAVAKAGPVVTDNGNFILDWKFPEGVYDWKEVEVKIKIIPGVVEVGLFLNMATKVYIGFSNGQAKIISGTSSSREEKFLKSDSSGSVA